jgi:hypothetical protein
VPKREGKKSKKRKRKQKKTKKKEKGKISIVDKFAFVFALPPGLLHQGQSPGSASASRVSCFSSLSFFCLAKQTIAYSTMTTVFFAMSA